MSKFDILPTDLTFAQAKALAGTSHFASRDAVVYQLIGPASHEGDFIAFMGDERTAVYFNIISKPSYFSVLGKDELRKTGHYVKDCRYRPTPHKIRVDIY